MTAVDQERLKTKTQRIENMKPSPQIKWFDDCVVLSVIVAAFMRLPYREECIDYLIETHFKPVNRPMRMCQPRDLLLQVKNYCLYNDLQIELKNEYMDFACDNYFSVM
jgi:hypothetical protein